MSLKVVNEFCFGGLITVGAESPFEACRFDILNTVLYTVLCKTMFFLNVIVSEC